MDLAAPTCATQHCPLCGQPNDCALAQAGSAAKDGPSCWCSAQTFSAALLQRVPLAAQGRACICPRCAQKG